jgi:hypothetical protein
VVQEILEILERLETEAPLEWEIRVILEMVAVAVEVVIQIFLVD